MRRRVTRCPPPPRHEKADQVDAPSGGTPGLSGRQLVRPLGDRRSRRPGGHRGPRPLRWMARNQHGFESHVADDIALALDEAEQ